jgi:hypothetical protein
MPKCLGNVVLTAEEAVVKHSETGDYLEPQTEPAAVPSSRLQLSDGEIAAAQRLLRRVTLADLDLGCEPAEIEYWDRVAARSRADLAAGDFTDGDEVALRNGMIHAELRLSEALKEGERRFRDQPRFAGPSGSAVKSHDDLATRFAAARWCDLVDLAQTLTGTTAVKCGRDRWTIVCPFHAGGRERTSSLVVFSPGKGWYCFSCQRGGDAVAFVMELMGIAAVPALEMVERLTDTWSSTREAGTAR